MIEHTLSVVATGFGLGWVPWAPGTFGSLLGLPLAWWLLGYSPRRQIFILAILLVMAVPLCHWASLWLGGGDVPNIVADEYLAFPISVVGLSMIRRPWMLGVAFLLFRFFDATKLPPINHIEAIGGGLGIVLDDVMAALYAWIVLNIGIAFWRRWHPS
ncbi:phosphatidylglycerophosphatase A [Pseudomonas sp. B10]|uniref:phosphatidylglycerophosphatase A family protein n=1 Tax=Pseudomonas sp. B10 TaxID=118613 RepID=UPI0009539186|nr:phosphatidylglycerophosphatase A [Pseudomonas sp. B10]SIR47510.1 phosphatidylglycerophosphatase A [Pseudomonas sp. B10]